MKKIFANILAVLYIMFFFTASGMASELYYIQNAKKQSVLPIVQNTFKSNGYTIKNNDPIYGTKGAFEATAVLQESQNDLYYYYSSTNDTSLNKSILSSIKNMGLKYKKTRNDTMSSSFAQTVNQIKKASAGTTSQTKVYNFDDSPVIYSNSGNTGTYNSKTSNNPSSTDSLKGYVGQIPVGSSFTVYLQSALNTASATKGDEVVAVLTKNWEYNGQVVAGQGSTLTGVVTKANHAGMGYRNGYVKINFRNLQTVEGKNYNLATEDIEFKVDSDGRAADAATRVVAGAAIGALAGLLIGAMTKDGSYGKSTAISAGAGAVIGLGSAAMEEGSDAEIPTFTEMSIKLTAPLNVVLSY